MTTEQDIQKFIHNARTSWDNSRTALTERLAEDTTTLAPYMRDVVNAKARVEIAARVEQIAQKREQGLADAARRYSAELMLGAAPTLQNAGIHAEEDAAKVEARQELFNLVAWDFVEQVA